MDEEEQMEQGGGQGGSRGGLGSKVKGIEDKAKDIQKGANNRAAAHKKKATQKGNKAKDLQGKAGQGGKEAAKAGKKAAKASKQAAKHTKKAEKMAKIASKAGKVASAASKLTAILSTVGIVLIIIIAIVGILVFIITGFGLIMKGLEDLADGFMEYMDALWDGQQNNVDTTQIAETLGYLDEMEYDLYGYGFVTKEDALIDADKAIEDGLIEEFGNEEELKKMRRKAELVGMDGTKIEEKGRKDNWTEEEIEEAKKWKEEKKQEAKEKIDNKTKEIKEELKEDYGNDSGKVLGYQSDTVEFDEAYRYIIPYLVSDNYAKCIKNNNKNFKTAFSGFGTFFNGLFNNNTAWGSGLISIYHEDGVGKRGKAFGNTGLQDTLENLWIAPVVAGVSRFVNSFEGDVDVQDGYLIVKGEGVFSHDIMKYKIDGWIGRYGMPMEFLLATHIATMAPDVSLKLATNYSTDVEVLLHEASDAVVKSAVKIDGTQITQEEIQEAWDNASGSEKACALAVLRNTKLESRPRTDDKVPAYKCEGPSEWEDVVSAPTFTTGRDILSGSKIDEEIENLFDGDILNTDSNDGPTIAITKDGQNKIKQELKAFFLESRDTRTDSSSNGGANNNANGNSNANDTDNNSSNAKQLKLSYKKSEPNILNVDGTAINMDSENMLQKMNAYLNSQKWEDYALQWLYRENYITNSDLNSTTYTGLKGWLKAVGASYEHDEAFEQPEEFVFTENVTSRSRTVTSRSNSDDYSVIPSQIRKNKKNNFNR